MRVIPFLTFVLFRGCHAAIIAYYSDSSCTTSPNSRVLAFTDVCLPEAGQQLAVVLTTCTATSLSGSIFASVSMVTAPTCTGNAQVFSSTSTCTQIGSTSVYSKALDFTCNSGGNAFFYALDKSTSTCASTSNSALVRYVPILAGSCNIGGTESLDVQVTASGAVVALSFFSSTGGTCTNAGASFSDVPTTGTCKAVTGGGASSIKVWAATCAMTLFAGYDVVGTKISTTAKATETACSSACCSTAGCVAYSYGSTFLLGSGSTSEISISVYSQQSGLFSTGPVPASQVSLSFSGGPCVLLSNVTSVVPSSIMTGGIIPAFLAAG